MKIPIKLSFLVDSYRAASLSKLPMEEGIAPDNPLLPKEL
jgi:hypothetical protein